MDICWVGVGEDQFGGGLGNGGAVVPRLKTTSKMREYDREYSKRIRRERLAKGMCVSCGKVRVRVFKKCLECRWEAGAYRHI